MIMNDKLRRSKNKVDVVTICLEAQKCVKIATFQPQNIQLTEGWLILHYRSHRE